MCMIARQTRQGCGHMHNANRQTVAGGVGHFAGQHLIKHHAQTVQISAAIDFSAAQLLRAHVIRRAHDRAGVGHHRDAVDGSRDAEIAQYARAIVTQQNIIGLNVAVDIAFAVRIIQSQRHLEHHAQGLIAFQGLVVRWHNRAAGEVFHGNVGLLAADANIENTHDMTMLQFGRDPRLTQKAFGKARVTQQMAAHQFQRDLAVDRVLMRQIHFRHATLAQNTQHVVARNCFREIFEHSQQVNKRE